MTVALSAVMSSVPSADWVALAPVAIPVVAMLLVLVLEVPLAKGALRRVADLVVLVALLGAGYAVLWLALNDNNRHTLCVGGSDTVLPSCSFVVSPLTLTLQAIVVVGAIGCVLLTLDGPAAVDRAPHHALVLAAVAGALALAGARDLPTLVVAFETASLPAIGLVALRRDAEGAQAGFTFLITALASLGMLVLGVSLIYFATGQMHFDRIAVVLSPAMSSHLDSKVALVAGLGTVLALSGILFKMSAVPFHLWTPDTYAGAPMPIAAFLAVVSKAAGLAALVVLLGVGLAPMVSTWGPVIAVIAVFTVTIGNLVALRQTVAIRLLAWSTVAQAGWVLLPLGAARGLATTRQAVSSSVAYLVAYAVASLVVFTVVVLVARHHPAGEEHTLDAYRGLGRREPVAAAAMGLGLASLAGLPPGIMGLVAKVLVVRPLVAGQWWLLAAVAAVNVALGLVYYLRWGALLVAPSTGEVPTWKVRPAEGIVLGGAVALTIAVSVYPQMLAGLLPGSLF